MKKIAALFALALTVLAGRPAIAAEAKSTVETLDATLLDVMKNASALGYQGRYQKLAPVIEKTFDLPLMAQISVGPQWSSLTPDQQAKIVKSFTTLSVATYAARFDGYDGETFQIVDAKPTGSDQLVNTKLVRPKDPAVDLNYRLRQSGGNWRIIDVFLSGTISQLANYRSEFSTTLRTKGADGLVALIDQKIAALQPKA